MEYKIYLIGEGEKFAFDEGVKYARLKAATKAGMKEGKRQYEEENKQ